MSGRFCLRKFKYLLQIGNAHLSIAEYKIQNAEPGFIRACFENLGSQQKVKILESHETLPSFYSSNVWKLGTSFGSPYF
jgi:hypothetical protein